MSVYKILIILAPFIFCTLVAGLIVFNHTSKEKQLLQFLNNSSETVEAKKISLGKNTVKSRSNSFIQKQNTILNMLGIDYKVETLLIISICLFIVGLIVSKLLFKAGLFLMIYISLLLSFSVFVLVKNKIEKRKNQLTIEFLEKMRDITSLLSVGKTLPIAIKESIELGNISNVMYREFETIRRNITTGDKISSSFMEMYNRLQIDEIRLYAETLAMFEDTGGNLITIMKENDKFATGKLELKNAQQVFINNQKTSQKIIVGVPAAVLVFFFLFNPSFFGDFYSTIIGQFVGIICLTVLIVGVTLSNQLSKVG